jgi:hypothetical protein
MCYCVVPKYVGVVYHLQYVNITIIVNFVIFCVFIRLLLYTDVYPFACRIFTLPM